MKRRLIICLSILVLISTTVSLACSSFAAYSNITIYGSNFDYFPEFDYRVAIFRHPQEYDYFAVQFSFQMPYAYTTLGMNDQGLFANLQDVPQIVESQQPQEKFSVPIQEYLEWQLKYMNTAQQSLDYLEHIRLQTIPPYFHHTMVADRYGDSFVVAPGKDDHDIFWFNDNYSIQTNFYMAPYDPDRLDVITCHRFQSIHQRLTEAMGELDVERGFHILEGAFQGHHTQISTIFLPDELEIYFVIQTDIDKIYRVSLKTGILDTYSGFEQYRSMTLDDQGVWLSDLKAWE